ncbi:MAG: DUF3810 family protein [Vicinamibacteria bacterium]
MALSDVILAAPFVSRLVWRSSLPGTMIMAAAAGAYAGSAIRDWLSRHGVRPVNFRETFGIDVLAPAEMTEEQRCEEIALLTSTLNRIYTAPRGGRRAKAEMVDLALTDYIAGITGQLVETSTEVRSFMLPQLLFPFALGACDILSGDIAIFREVGIFEHHVLAHEFSHRKGYFREVEAQLLAYLALSSSEIPALVQSGLAERLYRQMSLVSGRDRARLAHTIQTSDLRRELKEEFSLRTPAPSLYERLVSPAMEHLYEQRMRLTGQNGLSDYDEGFTNALAAIDRRARRLAEAPVQSWRFK